MAIQITLTIPAAVVLSQSAPVTVTTGGPTFQIAWARPQTRIIGGGVT